MIVGSVEELVEQEEGGTVGFQIYTDSLRIDGMAGAGAVLTMAVSGGVGWLGSRGTA